MSTSKDVITGLALSGGGANAHSFITGLFAGLYQSAQLSGQPDPLTEALGNTSVVSTNSGSTWFIAEAGWSNDFVSDNFSSGSYGKQSTWQRLIEPVEEIRQKLVKILPDSINSLPAVYLSAAYDAVINGNMLDQVSGSLHPKDYGSWTHYVYNDIINNRQVESNTLSSPTLGWLDNKTVIMSTGIQDNVPLISLPNTLPLGLPSYFWTDNISDNNKYDVVPLSIASKPGTAGRRIGEVSFTMKDQLTNASYILVQNPTKPNQPFPNIITSKISSNGNANDFGLLNASAMSSAGAASLARLDLNPSYLSKQSPEFLSIGQPIEIIASNNLRELSPMIQFSFNKNQGQVMPSEDIIIARKSQSLWDRIRLVGDIDIDGTKSNLISQQPARTVDGGYFDNTTVATNLRQLLKSDPDKSFRITAWVNDYDTYEALPGPISRLFEPFDDNPTSHSVLNPFGQGPINVPKIGVFSVDKGASLQDAYNSTKQVIAKSPDESISIERFEVDVTTQTNPLFDIDGGRTGKVVFYHAQNTKSDMLPSQSNIGELENNYNLAFGAFKDNSQFYQDFHSDLI